MTTTGAEENSLVKAIARRRLVFDEAKGVVLGDVGEFDVAESTYFLARAGTQAAYRQLASALRFHFGRQILAPIDKVLKEAAPSSQTPVWDNDGKPVVVDVDVTDAKTKIVTTKKFKLSAWHVQSVERELQELLDDLGVRFEPRRLEGTNDIWILLGGDKGGSGFKFGMVVVNQDSPQNPLNIRWLSYMGGGKDSRENLVLTALRPAFCASVNALKKLDVAHVVVVAKIGDAVNVTHASAFVPKGVTVHADAYVILGATALDASPLKKLADPLVYLAVHDGHAVGVAVFTMLRANQQHAAKYVQSASDTAAATVALREKITRRVGEFLGGDAGPWWDAGVHVFAFVAQFREPVAIAPDKNLVRVERLGLRVVLGGDNEMLATVAGHMGAAAMEPCYVCEATKTNMLQGQLGAPRTVQRVTSCAALNPLNFKNCHKSRKSIQASDAYKANPHHSIEYAPLLAFEMANYNRAPLHWLLGAADRALSAAEAALGRLDKTSSAAADDARHVLLARSLVAELEDVAKETDTALVGVAASLEKKTKQVASAQGALEKSRGRLAKRAGGRATGSDRAEKTVEANERAVAAAEMIVAQLKEQRKSLETEKKETAKKVREAKTTLAKTHREAKTLGVLSAAFHTALDQQNVVLHIWFQRLNGRHALNMLKSATEIWTHVENACPRELLNEFITIRKDHEAFWTDQHTVARAILAARVLDDDEIRTAAAAADRYQSAAARLEKAPDAETEKAVNLKRHMLVHIIETLKVRKTTGLFSESVFESWHAVVNVIERRYSHMIDTVRRAACVRKAFIVRTNPDGIRAEKTHMAARRRKRKSDEPAATPQTANTRARAE